MDHIAFILSERMESLQHAARPYIQSTARLADNFWNSLTSHSNSLYDNLFTHNSSFQSQLRYQWMWFQQHLSDFWAHLCATVNARLFSFDRTCQYVYFIITKEVDRSHVYIGCCCLILGFAIGTRFRATEKLSPRMRAVICSSYNGADAISMTDEILAPRNCGPNEVVVEVKAASISQLDIKISLGYGRVLRKQLLRYNRAYSNSVFPLILGRECSGRVVEIGSSVDANSIDVGDEVFAAVDFCSPGLASEIAILPAANVAKKPRTISHEAAAALPLSASIAWQALVKQAGLGPKSAANKRVLVHAVQTDIGCIAVQILKSWGAHVTGTVPKRAIPLAVQLGLDDLIVFDANIGRNSDFDREFGAREKFDIVLNTVGSSFHDWSLLLCKEGGTAVTTLSSPPASDHYGFLIGSLFSLWLRLKCIFWPGKVCGDTPIDSKVLKDIAAMVDAGIVQPAIDRVFDVIDADRAAQHVAKGDVLGKTIIRFRQRPLSRLEGFA